MALINDPSRPDRAIGVGTIASLPALAAARGNRPPLIVIGEGRGVAGSSADVQRRVMLRAAAV